MLDEQTRQAVYALLRSAGEAIEWKRQSENGDPRQLVATCRRQVTEALEKSVFRSLDARVSASRLSDEDWLRTMYMLMEEAEDPFRPKNQTDREFMELLEYIWSRSEANLMANMKIALPQMNKTDYRTFVEYFARYPLWGTLRPDQGDYDTLERRAAVLKRHSYDFLWLYCRLEDYLSRKTLYAILNNWAVLDTDGLKKVRSIFPDYWEPDIFPDNEGDIYVDVGAFNGDSIWGYINAYGMNYRKICAYEISPSSYRELRRNVWKWGLRDVEIRHKGVGAARGEMFLESSAEDATANRLRREGGAEERVEVVALDEEIEELTLLKMDIEGAEQEALLGSEGLIRSQHPKLAICTYHGYEDIWKIPLMIDGMNPEYKFYLRHYGGELIPTEFVLLCKP